ncbi:MAG: GMC family oxidoreductase [Enterobacterales bacterium]|nr:GMC family oxidoreductase [Enterobacterales bacterium]
MINLKQHSLNYAKHKAPAELECDVVIVGSGAGGGISAEILTSAGLSVIIVEEGPLRTAEDFKMQEKQAYGDLYQEVAGRLTLDKGIQILQGRSVGGSTTVNWTSSFRTPHQTLDHWADQFALKGFSLEQMTPWFDWVEKRLNIHLWQIPPNKNNQLLADGASKLGWSSAVIPRNVKGCANLGYCGMGCPLNAKQSMLVTTIPAAVEQGAKLISRARAESLIIEKDQVKGLWLSAMDSQGQVKQHKVTKITAKSVVLSAGAIGSPSVLLRSNAPDPYGLLGGRTFLHPVSAIVAKMPQKVEAFYGAPQSIYSDEFLWRDGVQGELGYKIEVPPMHPVLASTLLTKHGQPHKDLMSDLPFYQANLALIRDGFNEQSLGGQVSLDNKGYPQLDYPINETLWRGQRAAMLSMAELQFAAGAKAVLPLHMDAKLVNSWPLAKKLINQLPANHLRWQTMSAHLMGGCNFGEGVTTSVVNSEGQHHQLDNLILIDGSLFPTSLGVNPQLTIYSVAAKLASGLALKLNGKLAQPLAAIIQATQ